MSPLVYVLENNKISYQNCADDTQIYITINPDDYGPNKSMVVIIVSNRIKIKLKQLSLVSKRSNQISS